MKRKIVSMLQN